MNPNIRLTILIALLAALSACGGGGGGGASVDSGGIGGTGVTSTGVMTKGSIILNGVKFEDTTANISIDDTPKTAAALKDGMVVKLIGTINDDGITGTAQRVEVEIEVRGQVTNVFPTENPQRFVVLGQNVLVNDRTVYSDLANFAAITPTTLIEVHGQRDTGGNIRATRVEANPAQMGDSLVDEIRGIVTNRDNDTDNIFNVGTQSVDATGANVLPLGATFQNGDIVEVHCTVRPVCINGGNFIASRVEVEDEEDSAFNPGAGGRLEVEGLTSGVASPSDNDFFVAGIPVTRSGSTRYEGGVEEDLKDDIKVEAEGTWDGSTLVASKIEYKRSVVRLQGFAANRNTTDQTFDLQIANNNYVVKIELDSFTDGPLPSNDPNTCVQVRGQLKSSGPSPVVMASEVDPGGCSNSDRHFIQAPVEAESPETTITLLGFVLDVSNPTNLPDQWVDTNDVGISRTTFFDTISAPSTNAAGIPVPGTLVKVIFNDGTNSVREVEIED
jgi:hypothetical protein